MNLAPRPGLAAIDALRALHFRHMVFAAEVATTCGRIRFFVCTPAFSRIFVLGSFCAPLPLALPLALPLPHARQLSAATDCWQRHTAPVDLHRTDLHRTALDAHAHQCFAALAVKMQMNTAQSGSTARELCWPATLVLCDSSSRAHGPWLTEAHAHRVCTLDRNGQVETIAHLGSVRPPQRRAPPHETRAPLSAITVLHVLGS